VRKKYAIDDVMKISYWSLLGVRNDPKLERTPYRTVAVRLETRYAGRAL
jgi:hypothetical protein